MDSILSNIIINNKYAKYKESERRRENWHEIVDRNIEMHKAFFYNNPNRNAIYEQLDYVRGFIETKQVLPSMRSLQFAGKPILKNNERMFNCCYTQIDSIESFSDIMFLLLCGCGLGYSVQNCHINKLPCIKKPFLHKEIYYVEDSIEGWANAVNYLITSYKGNGNTLVYDYSEIRPAGSIISTSGGIAPGYQSLETCIEAIRAILDKVSNGSRLNSLNVHDIICHIASAVQNGGLRRSALICLFDKSDTAMINCKSGNWYSENIQRCMSNNSVVLHRTTTSQDEFVRIIKQSQSYGYGEPGVFLTNSLSNDYGLNPCAEISLRNMGMCNLTEINGSIVESQSHFNELCRVATVIGTLQAAYTNFNYPNSGWSRTVREDALLGVSITGICSGSLNNIEVSAGAHQTITENTKVAKWLGINKAKRITTIKPAGTTSCVFECSSGIHSYYSPYYLRRVRIGKQSGLYSHLLSTVPTMVEDSVSNPTHDAVLSVPQKAPNGALTQSNETALEQLDRILYYQNQWIAPTHIDGINRNNVSATIHYKESEFNSLVKALWDNKNEYNCISIFPLDDNKYPQAPFEAITKESYDVAIKSYENFNLDYEETEKSNNFVATPACAGGSCEIV